MSYKLKVNQFAVKDPDSGEYKGTDILSERTKEGLVAEIEQAGAAQISNVNSAGTSKVNAVNSAGVIQVAAVQTKGAEVLASIPDEYEEVAETAVDAKHHALASFVTENASGSLVSINDGADSVPVKDLTVAIEPVQEGSGDPGPENVRPITGWTGVTITRAGKNLLPYDGPSGESIIGGVTVTRNADGSITLNGTATSSGSPTILTNNYRLAKKLKRGSYVLRGCPPGGSSTTYRLIGNLNGNTYRTDIGSGSSITIDETVSTFAVYIRFNEGVIFDNLTFYPMLTLSTETDTSYAPYNSATYDLAFPAEPGTVYGGTLDVTTGVLTVTTGYIATYNGETLPGAWISDRDVYSPGATPSIGAQVVYDLAEPVPYPLTPTEVKTLLGLNNIWADTGDTAMEYRADTKLYIDKRIAALQALVLES